MIDKPCLSRFAAILGFPQPTILPCGLAAGHAGRHRYEAEWGDSAAEEVIDHAHGEALMDDLYRDWPGGVR